MKKRNTKPTASKLSVLGQLCNLIPPHLVPKLAREIGVDSMARSFSTWAVLEHLQKLSPGFGTGRRGKGLARRFRRVIHAVDSSTIALWFMRQFKQRRKGPVVMFFLLAALRVNAQQINGVPGSPSSTMPARCIGVQKLAD